MIHLCLGCVRPYRTWWCPVYYRVFYSIQNHHFDIGVPRGSRVERIRFSFVRVSKKPVYDRIIPALLQGRSGPTAFISFLGTLIKYT